MADMTKRTQQQQGARSGDDQDQQQLVRREQGQQQVTRRLPGSPFQLMRALFGVDPFQEMMPLFAGDRWSPDFEVRETKDSYVFKADLPGAKKDELDIALVGNRLQVSGKREEEDETRDDTYYAYERSYGSFSRTFTLPETADTEHISSELRDGVLTIVVPKRAEAQPRRIQIGSGEKH